MNVKNKTALITGAGSGIGRGIALSLARRGCHLALADLNEPGLMETVEQAAAHGVGVSQNLLDVRDREAVKALPKVTIEIHGGIDILVNNAGVASGGTFLQVSEETFDRVIDTNFGAVVRMTRAFLPHLQSREESRIVNISSVYGLISPIEQTAYSASKFAVRGFSNALRHELLHSRVGVTVVHPGGVATNIARNGFNPEGTTEEEARRKLARANRLLRMPPQKAGEIIVRGIEKNKARVLVGSDAKLLSVIERIAPVHYWKLLRALMKLGGIK